MGLFDFNANEPLSYEALQTRRKIAEQIAARRAQPYPKNIGEGIFSAADSLADAYNQRSLEARLNAFHKNYQTGVDKQYGVGVAPPAPTVAPDAAPTVVMPRPAPRRRADLENPYNPSMDANPYTASSLADIQNPMGSLFAQNPEDDYYG